MSDLLECQVCQISQSALPASMEMLRCAKCRKVYYCSRKCQKKGWKSHKQVCVESAGAASLSSNVMTVDTAANAVAAHQTTEASGLRGGSIAFEDSARECCVICQESLLIPGCGRQTLRCGHTFHERCILDLRRGGTGKQCPVCRSVDVALTSVQEMLARSKLCFHHNDNEEAVRMLSEILDLQPDHIEANQLLGEILRCGGYGVRKDVTRARKFLELAMHQGNVEAMCGLAWLHYDDDIAKTEELFLKAHGHGSVLATFELGSLYMQQGNLQQAKAFLSEARHRGSPTAACELGLVYSKQARERQAAQGSPLDDWLMAKQLFEEAKNAGDPDAARYLDGINHNLESLLLMRNGQASDRVRVSSPSDFACGDAVKVTGKYLLLIGKVGIVEEPGLCEDYWVKFADDELPKLMHRKHLERVIAPSLDIEEIVAQRAIEESTLEAYPIHRAEGRNAQISEHLLMQGSVREGSRVLCLKFSRSPAVLERALLDAPELASCLKAMDLHNMPAVLPCKAKIFVLPEHYQPTVEAVRLRGLQLSADNVLVEPNLEQTVLNIVKPLQSRPHSVRPQQREKTLVPLAFASVTSMEGISVEVSRTFLSITVPSSLRSPSDADGARTVSTTDADPRKNKHHRRATKRD